MKTIGLIGGMSWESSLEYYRIINEVVRERLGGLHSAKSLMVSVDFAEIEVLQHRGEWEEAARHLVAAAHQVERGGADCLLICTNTMHIIADQVQAKIGIPLIHIADATAAEVLKQGCHTVGLLGTRFTMEEDFYRGRLVEKHGLTVLIPETADRAVVHEVIYDELCLGVIDPVSKNRYLKIIEKMVAQGAEGIILGCTEIGLLVHQQDCQVPLFDTTRIHAAAGVDFALLS